MTTRDAIKAGLATALFTFGVLFGASLTGWLQDVVAWAQAGPDEVVVFPDAGVLAKAAVAAIAAAAVGLVNTLVRLAQSKLNLGTGPVYRPVQTSPPASSGTPLTPGHDRSTPSRGPP